MQVPVDEYKFNTLTHAKIQNKSAMNSPMLVYLDNYNNILSYRCALGSGVI